MSVPGSKYAFVCINALNMCKSHKVGFLSSTVLQRGKGNTEVSWLIQTYTVAEVGCELDHATIGQDYPDFQLL